MELTDITTGWRNLNFGFDANPNAADAVNQIVMGHGATGVADNSVTLGNSDTTAVYMAEDSGATIYAASIDVSAAGGVVLENDETITNSTDGTVLVNGEVAVGTGAAAGVLKSNGDFDLSLQTGNTDSGKITITDGANGNITLTPDGTGAVVIDGFSFPTSDGSDGQVLKTDGNGQLSWVTDGGSSGSGSLGHYSETEISNLSPSVGDIAFDYTNQQLKMYVKGTSSDTTRDTSNK